LFPEDPEDPEEFRELTGTRFVGFLFFVLDAGQRLRRWRP
jgi:hypothetical protein